VGKSLGLTSEGNKGAKAHRTPLGIGECNNRPKWTSPHRDSLRYIPPDIARHYDGPVYDSTQDTLPGRFLLFVYAVPA
jgi:hypothetical protein